MKRVIADEDTAYRVLRERRATMTEPHSFSVFSYEQPRSKLTLFGVEVVTTDANGGRQTETILFQ